MIETSFELDVPISKELLLLFSQVSNAFEQHRNILKGSFSDVQRKTLMDELGEAGSRYRNTIYDNCFSGEKEIVSKAPLLSFLKTAISFLEHSIEVNKRNDGMYHAYNLMTLKSDHAVSINHLPEMLEGQVAVLSSGHLSSESIIPSESESSSGTTSSLAGI